MRLWDRAVVLLAQVLEDEKVMEAMAKRSIPEFRAGDSLEVKLVPPSDPDNRYSRASARCVAQHVHCGCNHGVDGGCIPALR